MSPPQRKAFVGFGFGPIQAGIFLWEAFRAGRFERLVVAEVISDVVRDIREDGGHYRLNIAHRDRVESVAIGPIEMENPTEAVDRERIIDAIVGASEIATAVPSVRFYRGDSPGSIHRVLAAGLARRFTVALPSARPLVVYAAENHNRAAEILAEAVLSEVPEGLRDRVREGTRFLDTVIGKMSGVITSPERIAREGLACVTSRSQRAFLVEEFDHILISRIRFPSAIRFQRGIERFEEKDELLPFEEAKLHGHNAAHALAAYLALALGLARMEELRGVPGAVEFVRDAFLEESGSALLGKWKGVDPLFTPEGFRVYVDDLIARMFNPHLGDLVERVARDPERKLAWEDRLVGTLRLALSQGVPAPRFAVGAALALSHLEPGVLADSVDFAPILRRLWGGETEQGETERVLSLVEKGLARVRKWRASGGQGLP